MRDPDETSSFCFLRSVDCGMSPGRGLLRKGQRRDVHDCLMYSARSHARLRTTNVDKSTSAKCCPDTLRGIFHATDSTRPVPGAGECLREPGDQRKNAVTASRTFRRSSSQESRCGNMFSVRHSAQYPPSGSCTISKTSSSIPLHRTAARSSSNNVQQQALKSAREESYLWATSRRA